MRDALEDYIKWVRKKYQRVRNAERATEWSLIGPFFTVLGYDVTDPEQWAPQFRVGASSEQFPERECVDFAILQDDLPVILVEVKAAGEKKLVERHQPQLASYFEKAKGAKIGVLTSGVEWRFFTDRDAPNRMDAEPFETWNVLHDKQPPTELLGILRKDGYTLRAIQEFIDGQRLLFDDEVLIPPPSEQPQDPNEILAQRGAVLTVSQGLRRCEWEPCRAIFVAQRLRSAVTGLYLQGLHPRFCSNVCRSRASQARTGKHLP